MPFDPIAGLAPTMTGTAQGPGATDSGSRVLTYVQAISEALRSEMQRDENVLVLGGRHRRHLWGRLQGHQRAVGGVR